MHPWIAEQANREHIAELRSLGRPVRLPLAGWGLRRLRGAQARLIHPRQALDSPKRRISVRF
jgi:hypothetical protein